MPILSQQEFLKGKSPTLVKPVTDNLPAMPQGNSTLKDLGIGFVKGVGNSALGIQRIGQGILSAFDPKKTYSDMKEETAKTLKQPSAEALDERLKADNTPQKVGKALEFAAEFLFPVGKAAGAEKAIGASFEKIGSKLSAIPDDVIEGGMKVKDKVADLLVRLDEKTKTALERTSKDEFQKMVDLGKKAVIDDRNRTPLEQVGDDIIDGLKQVKSRAQSIGEQKSAYLDQARIGLQRVGTVVRDAVLDVKKTFGKMDLDPSDKSMVQDFFDQLKTIVDNPTMKQVDQKIDRLQDTLYKAGRNPAVQVTDRVTGQLRKILGKLNSNIGDATYKNFNKEYGDLMDVVRELNAKVGKEGGTAGSFVKRLFSPSDARTKELFEQLEKYTGRDFTRDARLAKFVMEALGDTRALNILEQIPTSVGGVVKKTIDFAAKKIADPLKSAERFIEKGGK